MVTDAPGTDEGVADSAPAKGHGRAKMGLFRLLGYAVLSGGVFLAGYLDRAVIVLVPLSVIWIGAEVVGRWGRWRHARRAGDGDTIPTRFLMTVAFSVLVVSVLYAAGRSVESFTSDGPVRETLGALDWFLCGALLVVGAPLRAFGGSYLMFWADAAAEALG